MIVWDYALAVFSEFKDGVLSISPDVHGAKGSATPYHEIQPLGHRARPRDPDTDSDGKATVGAGLLTALLGHFGFCLPTTDPRALERIPPTKKGGTCLHSTGPVVGFYNIDGDNGSQMAYVPYDLDADGNPQKSLVISIDTGTVGQENIQIRHGEGHGVTIMNDAKHSVIINNKGGDACIVIDDDGITLNGNVKINGGLVMGEITTAQPIVLAPELLVGWAQMVAALTTISAAAGGMVPPIVVPTSTPVASTKGSASP